MTTGAAHEGRGVSRDGVGELGSVRMRDEAGRVMEKEVVLGVGGMRVTGERAVRGMRTDHGGFGRKVKLGEKTKEGLLENPMDIFRERANEICKWIWELFPQSVHDNLRVAALVVDAYRVADEDYGVMEAVAWADNFTWPTDVFTRDEQRLAIAAGDLAGVVAAIQRHHSDSRLSHTRIQVWVDPLDDDFDRLHDLADGMRVLVDDTFVPSRVPPPLRAMYKRAAPAVNRLLYEWWLEDLAVIVRTSTLLALGNVHFSPAHWTTKAGKREGRVLFDSSDDSMGPSLNSDGARDKLRAQYGDIHHPTLDDFVLMVLDAEAELPGGTNQLTLWKWDLRKAFTLLSFRAEDARLLACELTDDLSLVYHTGLFGWTGTPFAFQVVSRVLHRNLLRKGVRQLVYVDDIGGACLESDLTSVKQSVRKEAEGLLGPNALAEQKWESGRRIDYIGWVIDLDSRQVFLKRRNFLKVLHGFFAIDLNAKWTGRVVERLASWASRYAAVLRHLKPFSDDLYSELRGWRNRDASRTIGPRGRRAILMWRVVLCAACLQEEKIARPLDSFRSWPADIVIAYDASLTGVGVGVERLSGEVMSIYRADFPFDLRSDASYQNTAEFIAVVIGCGMLVAMGLRGARIHLRGDSMTSLVWGSTEKFKGDICTSVAITYVLIAMDFDLQVVSTEHVRGVDNGFYDGLSRGKEVAGAAELPWIAEAAALDRLLIYCDPTPDLHDPSKVAPLWQGVKAWIRCTVDGL